MTHYQIFLTIMLVGIEILLCILVFGRHVQRQLPFFAAYVISILAAYLSQLLVFIAYGFRTNISQYYLWISYGVVILARSAAIAELCQAGLKQYKGIWALTWRLLALMTVCFLVHAAIDAQGQNRWFVAYVLTLELDVNIASFVILATMLLIAKYYRIPTEHFHKWLALGICFFCVVEFTNSSVLRHIFTQYFSAWPGMKQQLARDNDLWDTVYAVASTISMAGWCYLLRKPLSEPTEQPTLLPAEIYRELAPAINLRLRAFNDRLEEMLKP